MKMRGEPSGEDKDTGRRRETSKRLSLRVLMAGFLAAFPAGDATAEMHTSGDWQPTVSDSPVAGSGATQDAQEEEKGTAELRRSVEADLAILLHYIGEGRAVLNFLDFSAVAADAEDRLHEDWGELPKNRAALELRKFRNNLHMAQTLYDKWIEEVKDGTRDRLQKIAKDLTPIIHSIAVAVGAGNTYKEEPK